MQRETTQIDHLCSAFLRRVLLRMKELGLNQSKLAKRMHVSRPYVTALLTRDCNFTFLTAAKLAKALQMDFAPELCLQPQAEKSVVERESHDYCATVV